MIVRREINYDWAIDQAKEELNKWLELRVEEIKEELKWLRTNRRSGCITLRTNFKMTGQPTTEEYYNNIEFIKDEMSRMCGIPKQYLND